MNSRRLSVVLCLAAVALSGWGQSSRVAFDLSGGYAVPVNASYVDTYQNDDIYWNPNSGASLSAAVNLRVNDAVRLIFPADLVVGYTRYQTTDGRKVNTETQAGTTPDTTNTEWSFAPNVGAMIRVQTGKKPAAPYIGVGAALGMLWSFETWQFTNVDGEDTKLSIVKHYWPTPVLKGEVGWLFPLKENLGLNIATTFSMANFMMRKVVLTHYRVGGDDRIEEYDEQSTVYNYSFDSPDENKGGDCLLAGFNYNNYPQQKISTNVSLRIGVTYDYK